VFPAAQASSTMVKRG